MKPPRTMVYVDASNLIIEFTKSMDNEERAESPSQKVIEAVRGMIDVATEDYGDIYRRYWFGSHSCNTEDAIEHKLQIRNAGFDPVLLKRNKSKKEKGVDVALATMLLSNALQNQCERSILVAGDEDYAPVIREVRRSGHMVDMLFLIEPSSDILRVECDNFIDIERAAGSEPRIKYLNEVLKEGLAEALSHLDTQKS